MEILFNDMKLGPFVAVSDPKIKDKHIQDILEQGFIPIAMVEDKNNDVFEGFKDREFNTQAVFVTVYYTKLYES